MDTKALWDSACTLMKAEMSEVTYNTWVINALRPMEYRDDRFFVEVVTDFYYSFVQPRYAALIANALTQAAGRQVTLKLLTPEQAEEFKAGEKSAPPMPASSLNPKYTFESFVIGNSNRFAHAASLAVAESPADAYNPLFIYGGAGLGKTHLMHAIGHFVLARKPSARVTYVTSENFTNELITAIQTNRNNDFREKYRSVDVLLIDDIQFIAGRDSTMEEFFHTFNTLHTSGKQIVLTSDKPPKEIARLEERLRSRFEWGLIADIQKPDEDTRLAILRKKARDEHIDVEDDVLRLIAQRVDTNIRELEGCLTRLVAYSHLTGRPIDLQLAEEGLREVFARAEPRKVTCEEVVDRVAAYYGIAVEDLMGPRRNRELSVPRQVAMYLTRELTELSLPRIGQLIGNRDHTTVLHGCEKIIRTAAESPTLSALLDDLKKQLTER